MTDSTYQLTIDGTKVESDSSGDWLTYNLRNTGSNDAGDGSLVAKYEALAGSDVRWSAEEILAALGAGQALTVTQRRARQRPRRGVAGQRHPAANRSH